MPNKWIMRAVAASLLTFCLGIICGIKLEDAWEITNYVSRKPVTQGHYKLINPLLAISDYDNSRFVAEMKELKNEVNNIVQHNIDSHKASSISVYFAELDEDHFFTINGDELYDPASIIKVPVLMAYLKAADTSPGILNRKFVFTDTTMSGMSDATNWTSLKAGKGYTVDELLVQMAGYSDNGALQLLANNIDPDFLLHILHDLNLEYPDASSIPRKTTVKSLAIFLRVLYNSTYLSRQMSEKALEILTLPDFPEGIASTIPKNVTVADKFGMWFVKPGEDGQLHNFAIVYHSKRPYLICIMTKGKKLEELTSVIKEISTAVYTAVDANYKRK